MVKIIKVNPENPEPERIARATEVIVGGGVIGYPTDTVYGLGCSVNHQAAIQRIYELKKRDITKPLNLIIADVEQLHGLVLEISPTAQRLIQAFWPGPLTLIFKAAPSLNQALLGHGNTVGIRIPDSRICLELLRQSGAAIISTSANLSGGPEPITAEEVIESFATKIDLVIDSGPSPGTVPSTVVDTTGSQPIIRRVGVISENQIVKEISIQ